MDATKQSLALFNDPARWVVARGIPVFREHIATLPNGKPQPIDAKELQAYASEAQRLEQVEGVLPRITIGHTLSKNPKTGEEPREVDQPPIVGFARNARFTSYGPPGQEKPAVLYDHWYLRDAWEKYQLKDQFPYRSPEVYLQSRQITGIALLKRDPKLDMGMTIYQHLREAEPVALPSMKAYYQRSDGVQFYLMADDDPSDYAWSGRNAGALGAGQKSMLSGTESESSTPPIGSAGSSTSPSPAASPSPASSVAPPAPSFMDKVKGAYKPPSFEFGTAEKLGLGATGLGIAMGQKPLNAIGQVGGSYLGHKFGESAGAAIGAAGGPIGALGGSMIGGIAGGILGDKLTQDADPSSPVGTTPACDIDSVLAQCIASIGGKSSYSRGNDMDKQRTDYGLLGAAGGGFIGNRLGHGLGETVGDALASAYPAHAAAIKGIAPVAGKTVGTLLGANAGSDIENKSRAYASSCGVKHMADETKPAGPAPAETPATPPDGGGDPMAAMQDQIAQLSPEEFAQLLQHLTEMYKAAHGAVGGGEPPAAASPANAGAQPMHRTADMALYARLEAENRQMKSENQKLQQSVGELQQFAVGLTREKVVYQRHKELDAADTDGFSVTPNDYEKATRYSKEMWDEHFKSIKDDRPRSHKNDRLLPIAAYGRDDDLPTDKDRVLNGQRTNYERRQEAMTGNARMEAALQYMRTSGETDYDAAIAKFDKNGKPLPNAKAS